jgi:uncharacterized protein
MAFDPSNRWTARTAVPGVAIDAGLRQYMLRVYTYMAGGLALTGVVAYFAAASGLYLAIMHTILFWIVLLAPLGLVMLLSFRIGSMSLGAAQATFWAYAGLVGLSVAGIFYVYTGASIATTFFVCAAMFAGMSIWGYTTKRDLTGMGSFLFMGLIGIVIASLVNIFLHSAQMQFIISFIGVIVFTGLTAYDTQQIKEMYWAGDGSVVAGKKAVMGALRLYLDFLNLFLMLLQFVGVRRN